MNLVEKAPVALVPHHHGHEQDLRARALRNVKQHAQPHAQPQVQNQVQQTPKFMFEPAMTDTSILTAKTNLTRQQRHAMAQFLLFLSLLLLIQF